MMDEKPMYNRERRERKEFDKKSLPIRRVAKVTKGGKRLRFSTVVVVGDHNGKVGVGLGRGVDVRSAVEKGERIATKAMKRIELIGDTIPHEITYKYGAAEVLLRPARTGTGVIAGSSVRTVLELAGIDSVYGKILGTQEPNANAYCTFEALKALRNGRVLRKMSKMRERIEVKKEIDEEKKKKAAKRKSKEKKTDRKTDRNKVNRRR
ncbi:MAG TPA: 30S ribosomal protein S5 [Candidatus Dojkabacteria bacterium]|nr:30S ribosomal protein S5 [Candidatus Dojkabacteria bacterium]HOR06128.1 30S ribosomal protein S5 [Candidatus Dojkabacteria bacterium]HOT60871.1 30S ribosomal protein S5 [Candidatus Dojkabacteria bacterium]